MPPPVRAITSVVPTDPQKLSLFEPLNDSKFPRKYYFGVGVSTFPCTVLTNFPRSLPENEKHGESEKSTEHCKFITNLKQKSIRD